jgi:hypothetical protein
MTHTPYLYTCFGQFFSSDFVLPFPSADAEEGRRSISIIQMTQSDVDFSIGHLGFGFHKGVPENTPALFGFKVTGVAYYFAPSVDTLWVIPEDGACADSVRYFLLRYGIPYVLQARGLHVLQGSAFQDQSGQAHLLFGPSGIGKSTVLAHLYQAGYPMISDSVVVISHEEDGVKVHPGYPLITLWKNTLKKLSLDADTLPQVRPQISKYHLSTGTPIKTSLPIESISLLKDVRFSTLSGKTQIKGFQKISTLIPFQFGYGHHHRLCDNASFMKLMPTLSKQASFYESGFVKGMESPSDVLNRLVSKP